MRTLKALNLGFALKRFWLASDFFLVEQFDRAAKLRESAAVTGIVGLYSTLEIISNAGVELAVFTLDNIDVPGHRYGLGYFLGPRFPYFEIHEKPWAFLPIEKARAKRVGDGT